jgi:hypothetical protein
LSPIAWQSADGSLFLFERLNATLVTPHWEIAFASAIAQWVIFVVVGGEAL